MTEPVSYAGHPKSITEIKSDRTENAADCTPRDALIRVLRDLDEGAKIEELIVCWRERDEDGSSTGHYFAATSDLLTQLGLLSYTTARIMSE